MRRRRKAATESGDIALADLAFGIAGPAVFLMLVFFALARNERVNSCLMIDPSQEIETTRSVVKWLASREDDLARRTALLDSHCPGWPIEKNPPAQIALPPALDGVCPSAADAILEKAGTTREGLRDLSSQNEGISNAMDMCISRETKPDCGTVSGAEAERLTVQVGQWMEEQRLEARRLEELLDSAECPPLDLPPPITGVTAPPLEGLCRSTQSELLQAAGLTQAEVDAVTGQLHALRRRQGVCLYTPTELGCSVPGEDEFQRIAVSLREFDREQRQRIDSLARNLRDKCEIVDLPQPVPVASTPLPKVLRNVCPAQQAEALARANLSANLFESIEGQKVALVEALENCLQSQSQQCQMPGEDELQRIADSLREFDREQRQAIDSLARNLRDKCEIVDLPQPVPVASTPLPKVLRNVCPAQQAEALARANLSANLFENIEGQKVALVEALKNCLQSQQCQAPDKVEVALYAGRLRQWRAAEEDETRRLEAIHRSRCPDDPKPDPAAVDFALLPAFMSELCPQSAESVLAEAGFGEQELLQVRAEKDAYSSALALCLQRPADVVTERVVKVNFDSCSTRIRRGGVSYAAGDPALFPDFEATVEDVRKAVFDAGYNRVDIFGHTDDVPVRQGGCEENHAQDNLQLSALRALAYRQTLMAAMEHYAPLLFARLQGNAVRIYAIGVGDTEPVVPISTLAGEPAEIAEARDRNRRIEIRFARYNPEEEQ